MAVDNLFLGMARGKVGDVVFSRVNGQQVARARNRSPKNPKSPLQTLQRICFNSTSKAYSFFKEICDHAFEGYQPGTPNQSEFTRINVEMLRSKLAYQIAYPFDEVMRDAEAYNFNRMGDVTPVANNWQVSAGSLRPLSISIRASSIYGLDMPFGTLSTGFTYWDLVNALGVERGDQLTFLVATENTSSTNPYLRTNLTGFSYARIILEPADGDMSVPFLSGDAAPFAVNAPNPSNQGVVRFGQVASKFLTVTSINTIVQTGDDVLTQLYPILGTVILSRRVGDRWLRSSQALVWTRNAVPDEDTFDLAYLSYQDASGSSLYLNQAE